MDAKVTLSFDKYTIEEAKKFAEERGMSLSRLTEFLYRRIIMQPYNALEDIPVADWVNMLADGNAEYKTSAKSRKELKAEYFNARGK